MGRLLSHYKSGDKQTQKTHTKILGFIEHIVETMVTAPKHIVEMYGE